MALTMIRVSFATADRIKKHGIRTTMKIKIIVNKLDNVGLLNFSSMYWLIGLNNIAKTIAQNIARIKSIINTANNRVVMANRIMNTFLLFI